MSLNLATGLLLQLLAVAMVLFRTRGRWLAHAGVLFVLVSSVYYGWWELVQIMFPGRNFYRTLVYQEDIDAWILIVSIALFLFAIVYCATLRNVRKPSYDAAKLSEWARCHFPGWRLLLLVALPGFWITISGRDFGYWINNLSAYFTNFALLTASTAFILRSGPRFVLPVMLIQALLFVLIGARSAVVLNSIVLLSILVRFGVAIRWRQMMALGVVGVVLMMLISAARVVSGRFDTETTGGSGRVEWLKAGLSVLTDPATLKGAVADDFIYRFDGNAFNGMVCRELGNGCRPAGFQSFRNNVRLMVPSFANPRKLDNDVADLFEEDYTVAHYGLPEGIDYLVGTLGIIYSYHGAWGLWCIVIFMGWFYAMIDNWLAGSRTTWAFCMGLGFITTSLLVESAIQGYFGTFRSLMVFYFFVQVLLWIQRYWRKGLSKNKAAL